MMKLFKIYDKIQQILKLECINIILRQTIAGKSSKIRRTV